MDIKSAQVLGGSIVIAAVIIAVAMLVKLPRYQIHGVPAHIYVLDVRTGQVWEKFAPSGSGESNGAFNDPK